jgi:hypothetical protein
MNKDTKEKLVWLDQTGYINMGGEYRFYYQNGDYAAGCRFDFLDIATMPLHFIKAEHERFMEKAKKKEVF